MASLGLPGPVLTALEELCSRQFSESQEEKQGGVYMHLPESQVSWLSFSARVWRDGVWRAVFGSWMQNTVNGYCFFPVSSLLKDWISFYKNGLL